MSQTLTFVSTDAVSPPTLKANQALAANAAAFYNLDNQMVVAVSVVSKIYQVQVVSGIDYRTNHTQLRRDAQTFIGPFNIRTDEPGSLFSMTIQAAIDWNTAYAANSAIGTDVNALVGLLGGLRTTPEKTLWEMYLWLKWILATYGV